LVPAILFVFNRLIIDFSFFNQLHKCNTSCKSSQASFSKIFQHIDASRLQN
jgi:hypothetical protein